MTTSKKTIAHEWFEEVWNQGNAATIDRLFAVDGIAHGLADEHGKELRGPVGFKPYYQKLRGAFPDIHVEVMDTISEGDKIAARCTVRGTHRGDQLGMPATGRRVEFGGVTILRLANGKIVEAWNHFDFQVMAQQLAPPA